MSRWSPASKHRAALGQQGGELVSLALPIFIQPNPLCRSGKLLSQPHLHSSTPAWLENTSELGNAPEPDSDLLCQWKPHIYRVGSGGCLHPAMLCIWASPSCLSLPICRVCVRGNAFESLRKKKSLCNYSLFIKCKSGVAQGPWKIYVAIGKNKASCFQDRNEPFIILRENFKPFFK